MGYRGYLSPKLNSSYKTTVSPTPTQPSHARNRPNQTSTMPSIDKEKESYRAATHREHANPDDDKTLHFDSPPSAQEEDPSGPALDPGEKEDKATQRLIRKIDIRLLPVLAVIYAFALIDRVNLPNARIAGMDADLGLSVGDRYSLVVMIFFVSLGFRCWSAIEREIR